jgi:UDP:flavonoid glycosyltransferase YjiC (YdhE family)
MKILIASIAVPGHLNPLLAAGNILKKHGHEVLVQTGSSLKSFVEAAGFSFISLLPEADIGPMQYLENHPERQDVTPGIEVFGFDMQHFFSQCLPAQAEGLKIALKDFPADLILVDSCFFGTLPLLLGPRENRPAIAHLGITVLNLGSGKNVPPQPGASAEAIRQDAEKRDRTLFKPVQSAFDAVLSQAGASALPCSAMEAMSILPDLYLHPGIRSFEYPDLSASTAPVHYIGSLPLPAGQHELPEWWHQIGPDKKVVLVTQGTVANRDLGQLVAPALTGLAEEKDLIVVVTTGGQPLESIPVDIPSNAHIAAFLPYQQILPRVDLLITNGGYGTVNMALAHGIPIISAGLTEDKEEVSAHVQWSGAGIDLKTNQATPESVYSAVQTIFTNSSYRACARELALEFASHNPESELLTLLEAHINTAVGA